MGYRSIVGIKCQKKSFELFKSAYEEYNAKPDEIYHNEVGDEFIMIWDWWKWNTDFEEVEAIENVMSELDVYDDDDNPACDKEMGYVFIRLGEDDGDVEYKRNTYDLDFYYERKIDTYGFTLEE